jgi:RNA polymerase sigma factor (sigma-70 family)
LAAVPSIGRASGVDSALVDGALVNGAVTPEADATRALYEAYANQVFRYCLHQLGSREEAEDAVQSTFLNAFRGIKRGVVPELEAAWLFKIAHNVCLSRRRSTWRRGRIESPADFEVIQEVAPAPARRADELIGLQDVLEQLPETQRRAILLREWQGLSYREIAAELKLSQAAVETLIFRARRSLARGLEQPQSGQRRRARALDWGNVLAGLKTALLGGSVAAKVAATVAVVSATTVVAASPMQFHQRHHVAVVPKPHTSVKHVRARPEGRVAHVASTPATQVVAPVPVRTRRPSHPHHPARSSTHHRSPAEAPHVVAPASVTAAPTQPGPAEPASQPQPPAGDAKTEGRHNGNGNGNANGQTKAHGNGNGHGGTPNDSLPVQPVPAPAAAPDQNAAPNAGDTSKVKAEHGKTPSAVGGGSGGGDG